MGKSITNHLQEINLIFIQLVQLGIIISDEDIVDTTLNSLPKSWKIFKQIQKSRDRLPTFGQLEGLILQEEINQNLEKQREAEEIYFAKSERGSYLGHPTQHGHSYRVHPQQ